jgi:hypothetical protein
MSIEALASTYRKSFLRLAPKALYHASLGQRPRNPVALHNRALKARLNPPADFSIPDIPLVEINAVPAEQLAEFLLKRASAMMFLLRIDVLQHGIELTRAH